ncbi:hypothetical protein Tco_0465796, partial [Tanacetum coccineum]
MRELREDTFSGNKNEDAHDHIDRVLNIVSLFNIPGVPKDTVLLHVFPFTLTGSAKRLVDILTPGAVNTWDLLKKAFIQSFDGNTNYAYSQKWHDGTSSKNISSNNNTDGLAAIVEEVKYGEFGRPTHFNGSNGAKFHVGPLGYYTRTDNRPPYRENRLSLKELMNKHQEELARRSAQMDEWIKKLQENAEINTWNQSASLKNIETQIDQLTKEVQSRTIMKLQDHPPDNA